MDTLPLEEPARWNVATVYQRRTKAQRKRNVAPVVKGYELRFGDKCHEKATTEQGAERLREMAKLFNQRKAVPLITRPITAESGDLFL